MKLFLAVFAVLLMASASYATDYSWIDTGTNVASAKSWNDPTAWNLGVGYPSTGSDRAIIMNGFDVDVANPNGGVWTLGEFIMSNTGTNLAGNAGGGTAYRYTMNVVDDCGLSGDFWYRSTSGVDHYATPSLYNIDGNYFYAPTTWGTYVQPHINLYGTNKAYKNNNASMYGDELWNNRNASGLAKSKYVFTLNIYGTYYDNGSGRSGAAAAQGANSSVTDIITVKSGGKILTRPDGLASWWQLYELRLEDGQANLPKLGDCVTFRYGVCQRDNGISNKWAMTGGVIYPYDVIATAIYWNPWTPITSDYTLRIRGGDVTIGRDFMFANERGTGSNGFYYFTPTENGTTTARNVTIYRDFLVGTASASGNTEKYGLKLPTGPNSSTIRVGRDLVFGANSSGYYTWLPQSRTLDDLGNATIRVGRNLMVYRMDATSIAAWTPGTSTIIMDGNGTVGGTGTQLIHTFGYIDGIALNNLVIDSPLKSVVLDNSNYGATGAQVKPGGLRLTGDLTINTRFNDSDLPIAFNGPDHHLTIGGGASLAGGSLDNIILLTNAVLRLGSNATMDNLEMQSGSKLYLEGFTLLAEGQTFVSDLIDGVNGVAFEQGTIYGTFGVSVPEPTTLLLLGTGALGVFGYIRRRRMA